MDLTIRTEDILLHMHEFHAATPHYVKVGDEFIISSDCIEFTYVDEWFKVLRIEITYEEAISRISSHIELGKGGVCDLRNK